MSVPLGGHRNYFFQCFLLCNIFTFTAIAPDTTAADLFNLFQPYGRDINCTGYGMQLEYHTINKVFYYHNQGKFSLNFQ